MQVKTKIKSLVLISLILTQGISAMALQNQVPDAPMVQAANTFQTGHQRLTNSWLQSENPAGLSLAGVPDAGNTLFSWDVLQGSFYRPQEAEAMRRFGFFSERYQSLKRLRFRGNFAFQTINEDNRQWSNVNDALNGNPYVLASERGGDWKRQFYQLGFGASTDKLLNLLFFGIDVNYIVQSGARQNDPRPLNNANLLEVKPGFIFPLGNRSQIGIHGFYSNQNEEISITVSNTDEQQRWYRIRGLGEYRTGQAIGLTRAYNGSTIGGGLQYATGFGNTFLHLEASLKQAGIDATDGSSVIQHGGEFNVTTTEAILRMNNHGPSCQHHTMLFFRMDQREGIEHSQSYDNVLERWVTFATTLRYRSDYMGGGIDYAYYRGKSSSDFSWMAGLGARYVSEDARFLLPLSSLDTRYIDLHIRGAKPISRNRQSFYLSALAGYKMLLDSKLVIHPEVFASGRTDIANNVVKPDFDWQSSDFIHSALGLGYQRGFGNNANHIWMSLSINRIHPLDQTGNESFLKSGRNYLELKLGLVY